MISDRDVSDLYRCLLGRPPESENTVAAFKSYYPTFAAGRAAILESNEFKRLHAARSDPASMLAGALIAGAAPAQSFGTTIASTMRLMLRQLHDVRLAVLAGSFDVPPEIMLPLDGGTACVLHANRHFSAELPGLREFPGARAMISTGRGPEQLAGLLTGLGLRIDVLAAGGEPAWFEALKPCLAEQAILIGAAPFPDMVNTWSGLERPLRVDSLHVRHFGGWFLPVRYTAGPAAPLPPGAPNLAVAAIVRNEEASIVNMLASAAPVAYCFVILDTGSSDNTIARAHDFLAASGKPHIVKSIAPGRFDVMRNAALDLVPEDAGWVLMLDADEELAEQDYAPLLALLGVATQDAYALPRYNYTGPDKEGDVTPYPDRQVRLLRHTAHNPPRYEGAVHETIRGVPIGLLPLDAGVLGQGAGGPHIHHLVRRYRSPAAEARKQDYYRELAARYESA